MAELNFIVDQTALDKIRNTQLTANFSELKEALTEFVEPYKHLIVSEDAISSAKSDRAKINGVSKHIDDYRKMVKKLYTEPLKAFEDNCKALTSICAEGIQNIDTQVAEFENKRKEAKLEMLKEYYAQKEIQHPEYVTFDMTLLPKWENKTTSIEACKEYIDTVIYNTDTEVNGILALKSEWELSLLDDYKKTHDFFSALALHERLTDSKRREEERRQKEKEAYERQQEELRKQLEATSKEEELFCEDDIASAVAKAIEEGEMTEQEEDPVVPEKMYKVKLNVWCTYPQIAVIRDYLRGIGIQYEIADCMEA